MTSVRCPLSVIRCRGIAGAARVRVSPGARSAVEDISNRGAVVSRDNGQHSTDNGRLSKHRLANIGQVREIIRTLV